MSTVGLVARLFHSRFDLIPAALTGITHDVTARNESGGCTEDLKSSQGPEAVAFKNGPMLVALLVSLSQRSNQGCPAPFL